MIFHYHLVVKNCSDAWMGLKLIVSSELMQRVFVAPSDPEEVTVHQISLL